MSDQHLHDKIVVFSSSWPSPQSDRRLAFFPPAKRGDIRQAVSLGARCIVLIDGEMIYNPPPTPIELRDALRDGVEIVGAASLGAVRAVELFDEGMIGVGWVFGAFLSGRVDADDELLSILDPLTHVQLTVPLINVRYGLQQAVRDGRLTKSAAQCLLTDFRSIHFAERTTNELLRVARLAIGSTADEIGDVLSGIWDIKRFDAENCLRYTLAKLG